MEVIKCVRCGKEVTINISNAKDSEGEVFDCPNCGLRFRYAPQRNRKS